MANGARSGDKKSTHARIPLSSPGAAKPPPGRPSATHRTRTSLTEPMLRKLRLVCALICLAAITLLFLDFSETAHPWLGWLAKLQFVPAVLALNVGAVLFLVVLTLLFGRVYCSVLCPLGLFQDAVSRIAARGRRPKHAHTKAKTTLRLSVLALFVLAMALGAGSVVALLDPYAAFGRVANNLLQPLWQWGNNLLALIAEHLDSYAFHTSEVWSRSVPTFLVALATFAVVGWLAARNGRTWCNTVCPVGTVLGFLSRFALFKVVFSGSGCVHCGRCERVCKASCVDLGNMEVDHSRCVACMNCVSSCPTGAIVYAGGRATAGKGVDPAATGSARATASGGGADPARRAFLRATSVAAVTVPVTAASVLVTGAAVASTGNPGAKAKEKTVDGGFAAIVPKLNPVRETPLVPPGAQSLEHFARHCTGCQLCVSVCPNGVLRPAKGLVTLTQPEMGFERGYCRPECVRCGEVCPTGAILPLTRAEKSAVKVGVAVWKKDNCVPLHDNHPCDNCARHCPTEAITMIPSQAANPSSVRIPAVNESKCIGCGACEALCPARPFSAIHVEGVRVHSEV